MIAPSAPSRRGRSCEPRSREASSDETASLASCPKTLSGAGSGVTIVIRTSREIAGAALGHERELVDGQRPTSGRRDDERQPELVLGGLSQQRVDVDRLARGPQRLGVAQRAPRLGPDADDRRVEVEGRAVIELGDAPIGVDSAHPLLNERTPVSATSGSSPSRVAGSGENGSSTVSGL